MDAHEWGLKFKLNQNENENTVQDVLFTFSDGIKRAAYSLPVMFVSRSMLGAPYAGWEWENHFYYNVVIV